MLQSRVTFGTILKGLDPLGKTFAEDQFIRTSAGAQSYRSFIGNRLVLANSFRLGLGFPLGTENRLPPDDLFEMGGASTVRGLPDGGVQTPRNNVRKNSESGGNHTAVFNVELRGRLWWWIWAVLFYDAGVLVDSLDEVGDEFALRQSLGFGVRWLILDQIPVRIDWAFPFAIAAHEEAVPLHIAIGYPF
jgi:outer membrane protein assembly factor BamA